jgi:hypothetical protein
VDERERVAEAVRRYFETRTGHAAGVAARTDELLARASLSEEQGREVKVRRLTTVEIEGRRAIVDADLTTTATIDHPLLGLQTQTFRTKGPVELVREGNAWKVADYTRGGRSLVASSWSPAGTVDASGMTIAVPLVITQRRVTRVLIDIHNLRSRAVVFADAWRGRRSVFGRWRYARVPLLGRRDVPPDALVPMHSSWRETLPKNADELRFIVRVGEAGGAAHFDIHLAIFRERIELVDGLPWNVRLSPRWRRWAMWTAVALGCGLMLAHLFAVAAVVLLVYTAAVAGVVSTAVRDERVPLRQGLIYASWVILMVVLAYVLVYSL